MAALEVYRTGLEKFPNEVTLLTGVARIYEAIGNLSLSAKYYKNVLVVSSGLVKAIVSADKILKFGTKRESERALKAGVTR